MPIGAGRLGMLGFPNSRLVPVTNLTFVQGRSDSCSFASVLPALSNRAAELEVDNIRSSYLPVSLRRVSW